MKNAHNAALRAGFLGVAGAIGIAASGWGGAQEAMPEVVCAAASPLPAELASWTSREPLAAAASPAGLAEAQLVIGQAVDAGLQPTRDVTYALRPEKPGGSVSHGGLYAFHITEAGHYRVALSSAAWIDVVHQGKGLVSTAHGRGPNCSGIRKIVDFTLDPGDYVLQISANAADTAALLVTRGS